MRQTLSTVLFVIAAVLVVWVKVVAPKPGSLRSDFTAVKTAVPSGMTLMHCNKIGATNNWI